MSGISDLAFRTINRSFGCEFAFTEMISARALTYQNRSTVSMLSTTPADRPLGVQLLANDPDVVKKALDMLQGYEFDLLDFNAACPVNKVTGRGEGASLLLDPLRLKALLRTAVDNSPVPVTVKIRSGWDETSLNARDIALHAEDAGIKGLFIHGRSRAQGYSGRVDYAVIGEVKKALRIPVIGSGDAFSPELIRKMFDETGCDGVVIARGAFGNPWIFRETAVFLENGAVPVRPDIDEITGTMTTHLNLCCDLYGKDTGTIMFRKFFAWYIKGLPGMKHFKDKAFHAKTISRMLGIIGEVHAAAPAFQTVSSL